MRIEGFEIIGQIPPHLSDGDLVRLVQELTERRPTLHPERPFNRSVSLLTGGKSYELTISNPLQTLTCQQTGELPSDWQDPQTGVWRIPGKDTPGTTNR